MCYKVDIVCQVYVCWFYSRDFVSFNWFYSCFYSAIFYVLLDRQVRFKCFIFLHFLHSSTSRTAHLEWANSHYLFGTPIIYSVNNYSFATRSLTPIPSLSFAVFVSLLLDYFLHTISLVLFLLAFVSLFLSLCLAFFVFVFVLLCVLSRSSSPHGVIVIGWFVTSMPASVWSGTSMKIMRNA